MSSRLTVFPAALVLAAIATACTDTMTAPELSDGIMARHGNPHFPGCITITPGGPPAFPGAECENDPFPPPFIDHPGKDNHPGGRP